MSLLARIRVISLAERKDRRDHCNKQFSYISDYISTINFFDAKKTEYNGAVGCALSHGLNIADLVSNYNDPAFIVFEDDFEIIDPIKFISIVDDAMQYIDYWDVFLLGGINEAIISKTPVSNFFRVVNSQTCHAYLFNRRYSPKLLKIFFNSALSMEHYDFKNSDMKWLSKRIYSMDQLWKANQYKDIFWASLPFNVVQSESYSDIEKDFKKYTFK